MALDALRQFGLAPVTEQRAKREQSLKEFEEQGEGVPDAWLRETGYVIRGIEEDLRDALDYEGLAPTEWDLTREKVRAQLDALKHVLEQARLVAVEAQSESYYTREKLTGEARRILREDEG
jgi:hypothetical protein